jgi:acyl-coenzyme A synthetase/AMP-(fatty) acid ligase
MNVQFLRTRVVAIEKRSSLEYVRAVLDRHKKGALVMPVEPGAEASFPGIDIVDRIACAPGGGWFTEHIEPRRDSAPAQVVLTSGTTGIPKAILLSHCALGDVTDRLAGIMQLDDRIREYVGVPVTYSFGFGRIRAIAAVGGASFLPDRGFRVDEFAEMLQHGEVNALSAVPTLLRLVLDQQERFKDAGHALRWLEIGSQAMTRAEKEAIRALFPNARIVQHYGLTEASRSTFLEISSEEGEALASVGRPNGEVETKITGDGLIAIRGPHVAHGVITADGVETMADADGWLVTRDLGHQQGGFLYFDGRADDVINVGGIKIPSELVEEKLLARLGSGFPLAVAPGHDRLRGQIVVVAHEPLGDPNTEAALHDAIAAIAAELSIGEGFALLPMPSIPRTETNKIRRHALTETFDRIREPAPAKTQFIDGGNAAENIVEAFVAAFGEAARDRNASFASLGGDSLHYVMMLTSLERHLPDLPEDWDRKPIAELCALAPRPDGVVETFAAVFGEAGRNEGASFQSLGGDSLHYVMMLTSLECCLRSVPEDWDTMSVGALSTLAAEQTGAAGRLAEPMVAAPCAVPQEKKRHLPNNLDTVRGLACILVVALHVVGVAPDEGLKIPAGSPWHAVMSALDLVRMPLFTALAGFLYGAMPATRDGFAAYMKRKAGQLLIPLLFATLAFWVLRQITYGQNERSLFWAYVYGYQHLWYIDALLLIFACVSFIDTRLKPTWRSWAGVTAIAALAATTIPDFPIMHVKNALGLLPFFILGLCLYRVPALLESKALLVMSVIAMVAVTAVQQALPATYLSFNSFGLFALLCGAASVIALLRLFPKTVWIEAIAAYSFTIYLWHPAANGAVRDALWKIGVYSTGLLFVIGVAAGVLIPIAMHLVLRRFPKIVSAPIIGR